jgi:membrane associated rhomboid family serine protease
MSNEPLPSRGAREPILNAPWPAMVLVVRIVGGYAVQGLVPQQLVFAWAFSPAALAEGRAATLLSALFLHGGWPHALMNAAFGLAFAAPVSRFLGLDGRGVASFVLFYLACGVVGNLGFAALHWGEPSLLVGASGALSGLMAAAARLIGGRGGLGPIFSPPVIAMGLSWGLISLLLSVTGLAPGANGAGIAWEAHVAGFVAGALLFGVATRMARG